MVVLYKNRRGFTLLEMVLVIAIILILAVVVWFSVSDYMNAAKKATEKVEAHNSVNAQVMEEAFG